MKNHWTKSIVTFILVLLYFLPCEADNAAAEPQDNVKEAESLDKRNLRLEAKLARREKELDQLREDFADAIISINKVRAECDALKLQAKAVSLAEVSAKDSVLMRALLVERGETTKQLKKILEEVGRLRPFFKVLLQVKKDPDSKIEAVIDGRITLLEERLKAVVKTLELDTKKKVGSNGVCRVLEVDPKFVILDGGRDLGVRIGSKWQVRTANSDVILQVVEVRRTLSASVVLKGDLKDLVAGAKANKMVMNKAER